MSIDSLTLAAHAYRLNYGTCGGVIQEYGVLTALMSIAKMEVDDKFLPAASEVKR